MKKITLVCSCLCFGITHAANPEPVIYGTVTTLTGESVTGTLRWGEQEMFLSDIFNGNKSQTIGIEHFSDEDKEVLEERQPGPKADIGGLQITFKSFFGNEVKKPYFNLPFGAIAQLNIDAEHNKYVATLHDGVQIISDDSASDSNDLSDEIYVLTAEGETKEYEFENLKLITFSTAPADAKRFDQGLYGTVTTKQGKFQGRFMWDQDERAGSEELDGYDDERNEHEIKFSNIKSIERKDNKSLVTLTDGKSLLLGGTNDVDSSNRGLWWYHPSTGRVEIKWDDFIELEFTDIDTQWKTFADYQKVTKPLSGVVNLADGSSTNVSDLAFDLNQQSGLEWLEVSIKNHDHFIPFSTIKKISKINSASVELQFMDGSTEVAYGEHSVSRDNNGLSVKANNQYRWILWDDVQSIEFNH